MPDRFHTFKRALRSGGVDRSYSLEKTGIDLHNMWSFAHRGPPVLGGLPRGKIRPWKTTFVHGRSPTAGASNRRAKRMAWASVLL